MRLSEDMKQLVLDQRLGFAATVSPDGSPNLSPKGTTTVWDDEHLVFADIRSPQTVRNLRREPAIEINVVDPITRKGYRFKGRAELHADGERYETGLRLLSERGYRASHERIDTVVIVHVEFAALLVSPVYDSGATEEEVAGVWIDRLARRPSGAVAEVPGAEPVSREHPSAALVRHFHELQSAFYAGGPIEPLVELLTEDVSWYVPGRSAIAGDYEGRSEVLAYFQRRRGLARARFRLEVREVMAQGDLVLQLVGGRVEQDGESRDWETVGVIRRHDLRGGLGSLTNLRPAPPRAGHRDRGHLSRAGRPHRVPARELRRRPPPSEPVRVRMVEGPGPHLVSGPTPFRPVGAPRGSA